ncbi:hypothetical protein HY333_01075, partial [Candidatus Collierbacteria bacterium]|nr:hypothetical protein [Candidatus Collierbacteria bacterium]
VWGMRYDHELFWVDEFKKVEEENDNFNFDLTISRPSSDWQGQTGRVSESLEKIFSEESFEVLLWEAYLCGSTQMVEDISLWLMSKGMERTAIHFEKFF